jgi:outer membrane protein OmpA-like peptidoglycan-associated protein
MLKGKRRLLGLAALAGASMMLSAGAAHAQKRSFALDRLQMPGAPDDGVVLFRPVTQPRTLFFAQLGLGYTRVPLRTNLLVPDSDRGLIARSNRGMVENQFTAYANVGIHLIDRLTFGVALPVTFIQTGANPKYDGGETFVTTPVNTSGAAAGELRLDARAVLLRSKNRASALGVGAHVFLPTGSNNFGGDGTTSALLQLNGETRVWYLSLVANVGFHFRGNNVINDPVHDAGLGIGRELRAGVGAFLPLPLSTGKFRIGGTIFGQTGMENNAIIGNTIFRKENTPLEFNVEARMRFGPTDRLWVGAAGGSRILNGYGAPDLRLLGFFGIEAPLFEPPTKGRDPKLELREKWKREAKIDTDGDGIPDEYDACPYDKEDGIGDANDGCPTNDRDGDGIPDKIDKCPDDPEDKDGFQDKDGCPDPDNDQDGIPDKKDLCPNDPEDKDGFEDKDGCPDPDNDKDQIPDVTDKCPNEPETYNGYQDEDGCPDKGNVIIDDKNIVILKKIKFKTASAEILPESNEILDAVATTVIHHPEFTLVEIAGHADERSTDEYNLKLTQDRVNSVMNALIQRQVPKDHLRSKGYGEFCPEDPGHNEEAWEKNRRVEFKIVKTKDGPTGVELGCSNAANHGVKADPVP